MNIMLYGVIYMKKFTNYLCFGLFLNALYLISNQFDLLPDFIEGLCVGVGLSLILIGIYTENDRISKIRDYKENLRIRLFENKH